MKNELVYGLEEELSTIMGIIKSFMMEKDGKYSALAPARGLLIDGPCGVGKTLLAKTAAQCSGLPFVYESAQAIYGTNRGDCERNLKKLFMKALSLASTNAYDSAVLILDDLDNLTQDREKCQHVADLGILAMLNELFEDPTYYAIFVLAVAVDGSPLDGSIFQAGRLECIVHLTLPDVAKRRVILEGLLKDFPPHLSPQLLDDLSRRTRGYTGADLMLLCSEALAGRMNHHHSFSAEEEEEEGVDPWKEYLERCRRLDTTTTTTLGEFSSQSCEEELQLSDLVGIDDAIQLISRNILMPLRYPEVFSSLGLDRVLSSTSKSCLGLLLYGPPGCGKTHLGRALASAARRYASFISVECPDLINKLVGQSEQSVAALFDRARQRAPCIIFLDHIEAIAGRRGHDTSSEQTMDRLLSTLLIEMDGISSASASGNNESLIIVIAATNHLEMLDDAILRPGRLDLHVHLSLPNESARKDIFHLYLNKLPLPSTLPHSSSVDELATFLASKTEGLSGADIQGICKEAALLSLRENIENDFILPKHLIMAMEVHKGSISK